MSRFPIQEYLEHHHSKMKMYALKLTQIEADAEDLAQDTFVKAWEKYYLFTSGTNLSAWLHTIMRNLFINSLKKKSRRCTLYIDSLDLANFYQKFIATEERVEEKLDIHLLESHIQTLNGKYIQVLQLRQAGFKYREIAEILDVPIGTVKSQIFRIRKLLERQTGWIDSV